MAKQSNSPDRANPSTIPTHFPTCHRFPKDWPVFALLDEFDLTNWLYTRRWWPDLPAAHLDFRPDRRTPTPPPWADGTASLDLSR